MRTCVANPRPRRPNPTGWAVAFAILAVLPIVPTIPGAPASNGHERAAVDAGEAPGSARAGASGLYGLSVSIALPGARVEPNAPFALVAEPEGLVGASYRYLWNDSLGTAGTNRSLTLLAPSVGTVSASVTVWDGLGDSAEASASVGVGDAPSIGLAAAIGATDTGLPIPLTIEVNGSFPPYTVSWALLPGGSGSEAVLQGPGELEVATSDGTPGYAWVQASVTDRNAVAATVDAIVAIVHPRPQVLLTATPSEIDAGSRALVTGLVVGGTPPYSWSAAASLPVINVTGASGSVGTSEPLQWSGEFAGPGNATVRIDLSDAAGVLLVANVSVRVFSALAPTLAVETVGPQAGAPLNLSVDLLGGVGPYTYRLTLSDGEESEGQAATSGPILWVAHPVAPGYLVVQIAVEDAVSGTVTAVATVLVGPDTGNPAPSAPPATGTPAPTPDPRSDPPPSLGASSYAGLAVLVLVAGGAIQYLWRRRRSATPRPSPADGAAVEVITRLLKDSDGTESSTLRVLAEEEGLTKGEVEAALRTLEERGRIHIEPGSEGSQLVRWTDPAPTAAPPGRAP